MFLNFRQVLECVLSLEEQCSASLRVIMLSFPHGVVPGSWFLVPGSYSTLPFLSNAAYSFPGILPTSLLSCLNKKLVRLSNARWLLRKLILNE